MASQVWSYCGDLIFRFRPELSVRIPNDSKLYAILPHAKTHMDTLGIIVDNTDSELAHWLAM